MGVWGQYSAVKRCIPRVSTLFADTVVGSKQKFMDFSRFSLKIARKNAGYILEPVVCCGCKKNKNEGGKKNGKTY